MSHIELGISIKPNPDAHDDERKFIPIYPAEIIQLLSDCNEQGNARKVLTEFAIRKDNTNGTNKKTKTDVEGGKSGSS